MQIAFFDSGIGGLTVLKEAYRLLPQEDYIYYADSKNAPYGIQSKEEITGHVFKAVDFLERQNIKLLVVACNTATSATIDDLRHKYNFPIVGMEPAVKPAIKQSGGKRVLVLATTFTLRGGLFYKLVKRLGVSSKIDTLALDNLVQFAEQFDFNSERVVKYLQNKFSHINIDDYGVVVLGCTHFVFYRDLIEKMFPDLQIVDGNLGTVEQMISVLKSNNLLEQGQGDLKFYFSGEGDESDRTEELIKIIKSDG